MPAPFDVVEKEKTRRRNSMAMNGGDGA